MLIMCSLLLLSVAAHAGMKVKSESAKGADLSSFTTYTWRAADPATSGLMIAEGTRIAGIIEEVGDKALAKAGLEKRSVEEAGLIFRYRAFAKEMIGAGGGAADLGSDVTWLVGSPAPPTVYKQGTLLIEALDAKSGDLLWAGWAQGAIEAIPKREKVAKKAEKAMSKIMKEFVKK
jgi:hypothetical protein